MLSGSELWLLRLMADRGLALLDASGLVVVVEERGELRVAATSGDADVRVRILPVAGSALGVRLANARDTESRDEMRTAVEDVLDGLAIEIEGLRHLITELRPAALDDLGLVPALDALIRRTEAHDGLEVTANLELDQGAN